MLDVIHLIVTVLSDRPSFEWECNVTGRVIWFHPLKLTFSTCFRCCCCSAWDGVMLSGGLSEGWWAVLRMVTEGGDWVVLTSHFYGSHKGSWKATATLYRLCVIYCGLWLWTDPLDLCYHEKSFISFDNMGPLRCTVDELGGWTWAFSQPFSLEDPVMAFLLNIVRSKK